MAWVTLVLSGLMESVWALSLKQSHGFTQPIPTIVFIVALALSMFGLAHAVKTLPIGVAYAVWTGIGMSVTAIYSMATGMETASVLKVVLIAGILACAVGLKLLTDATGN